MSEKKQKRLSISFTKEAYAVIQGIPNGKRSEFISMVLLNCQCCEDIKAHYAKLNKSVRRLR